MRKVREYWVEYDNSDAVKPAKNPALLFYDLFDSFKGAVLVVLVIFVFFFRAVGVVGESMVPTLQNGNWVAVSGALFNEIKRGDIVVITQPWDRNVPIIKRVIAKGGDTVMIDFNSGTVLVNDRAVNEPYIAEKTMVSYDVEFPVTVPEGKIFVMGDNRNVSLDSRSSEIGFIDESYVLGKALIRLVPINEWRIY